jgi:hypothetical protein
MFELCVESKRQNGKMKDNQGKEPITDEIQRTREYKKNPDGVTEIFH